MLIGVVLYFRIFMRCSSILEPYVKYIYSVLISPLATARLSLFCWTVACDQSYSVATVRPMTSLVTWPAGALSARELFPLPAYNRPLLLGRSLAVLVHSTNPMIRISLLCKSILN